MLTIYSKCMLSIFILLIIALFSEKALSKPFALYNNGGAADSDDDWMLEKRNFNHDKRDRIYLSKRVKVNASCGTKEQHAKCDDGTCCVCYCRPKGSSCWWTQESVSPFWTYPGC